MRNVQGREREADIKRQRSGLAQSRHSPRLTKLKKLRKVRKPLGQGVSTTKLRFVMICMKPTMIFSLYLSASAPDGTRTITTLPADETKRAGSRGASKIGQGFEESLT
jgi:hypothetical protein